jgi:hypothetical protein
MSKLQKLVLAVLLFAVGAALFMVRTDREYINLVPTEGTPHGSVLMSGQSVKQTFIARRRTITRLGVFLRPAQPDIPSGNVTLTVKRGEQILAEQIIPTSFVDAEGAAQVRFDPPLKVNPSEELTLQVSVPPELTQALRLQQRLLDDTFDATNTTLTIAGVAQVNPAGYQVYFRYRPALASQLGGFMILGALLVLIPRLPLYILGSALLFALPAGIGSAHFLVLFAYAGAAMAGMLLLLQKEKVALLPALLGAHVFAFTTWLPLHAEAGRPAYALAALLPLIVVSISHYRRLTAGRIKQLAAAMALFVLLVIYLAFPLVATSPPTGTAQPRDIFLDPNQVVAAQKVPGSSWDHFGSYAGFINVGLVAIGIVWQARRRKFMLVLGIVGAIIAFSPLTLPLASVLPLPPQHLIILTTFALAYFAAWGVQGLRHFLDPAMPASDKVVTTVIALIVLLSLLDLWQVAASTLEYGRLL